MAQQRIAKKIQTLLIANRMPLMEDLSYTVVLGLWEPRVDPVNG